MKQVYKITYPTRKIYVGKDSFGSARYMGSPDIDIVNADFQTLPEHQRMSYTVRKEILWQSETATESELAAKEIEFIRIFKSNDPSIGYNRWPKFRADGVVEALIVAEIKLDADLQHLLDAWPTLPEAIKAGILAMIDAVGK